VTLHHRGAAVSQALSLNTYHHHDHQLFTIETTIRRMAITHLQAIFACLTCSDAEPKAVTYLDEKAALLSAHDVRPAVEIAEDVVATLLHTSLVGPALRMKLDSIVAAYGWRENIAKYVLEKLTQALQYSHENLGPSATRTIKRGKSQRASKASSSSIR
jgi:hypothetical protein